MVGTVDEDDPSAITLEEFRRAQASDRWCQAIRENMNEEGSQYEEDESGVLVRIAMLDGTAEALVPEL